MSYALGIPVPLNQFPDDVVTLRRCFVQLCDGDHCAALLLDHFYERATIRQEYIMYAEGTCGREPVPDRWIATSISQLQAKLSDLFDEQRLYEGLRLLAKKTFAAIRVDITEGDVTYCCSSNTINKALSALVGIPFQDVPPLEEQPQDTPEAAPRQTARIRQELPLEKKYKTEAARVAYQCKRARDLGLLATLTVEQWLTTLNHFEWKCAYAKALIDSLSTLSP
jgi:hypothetical protein